MGMYQREIVTNQSHMVGHQDYRSDQSIDQENLSYLEHHGILGQKWGVRRFQNKDGSLTKAGEARYGNSKAKYRVKAQSPFEKQKAKLSEKEKRMTEREEITRRKNALKERKKNLKNLGKNNKSQEAKEKRNEIRESEKQRDRRKVQDMTDDELRAVINRHNLEKQYREIIYGPEVKKGESEFKKALIKVGTSVLTTQLTKALNSAIENSITKNNSGNRNDRNENRRSGSNSNSRRSGLSNNDDWNDFIEDVARWQRRRR